nr:hypothetical protein [uncultured Pedobacter sp.]
MGGIRVYPSHALAASTDHVTGEEFPADSPYNQPEIIRALFFTINQLEALDEKVTRV